MTRMSACRKKAYRQAPAVTISRTTGNARTAAFPRPISRWSNSEATGVPRAPSRSMPGWRLFFVQGKSMRPIIIIGAGMAGYTAAREIRKLDKTVPLTVITADDGGFYSKPMLSNAFAQNKLPAQLVTQTSTQLSTQLDATILTGTRVERIDIEGRTLVTDKGALDYDKLVFAIGAHPIRLPLEGDAADQDIAAHHR